MTWSIYSDRISILSYFNDENINLKKTLSVLNPYAWEQRLEDAAGSSTFECKSWMLRTETVIFLSV